jgi:DNA-binding LacI/PurR family transcriptional regulator
LGGRAAGITSPKFDYYDEFVFYPLKDRMKKKSQRPIPPKPAARSKSIPPVEGKVQMEDIAQLAGVSRSTVSRALSHSPVVNAETRERIEKLARSLKYSIHVGARNLRLQQNRTVAVVLPFDAKTHQSVSDPFFVSLMGSLADALTARGYDMLVSRIDAERLDLAGDLAASGRAIGVILVGQWHHHDQINDLAARQSPIVVWGAHLPQQIYCTIGGDNIAGGMLATEHLIATGNRRIAFFGDVELPEVGHRFAGYEQTLSRNDMVLATELVHHTPFVEGSAQEAVATLIKKKVRFDAIFASSDLLAMEAISALRERGRRVPEDCAVVGYDDIVVARYYHPSLTTIRQPVTSGGEALVEALLKILDGKRVASQILPTELIVRESSVRSEETR